MRSIECLGRRFSPIAPDVPYRYLPSFPGHFHPFFRWRRRLNPPCLPSRFHFFFLFQIVAANPLIRGVEPTLYFFLFSAPVHPRFASPTFCRDPKSLLSPS